MKFNYIGTLVPVSSSARRKKSTAGLLTAPQYYDADLELSPRLVLELWVCEPLPVALDEGMICDAAAMREHQLTHALHAEFFGLAHGAAAPAASDNVNIIKRNQCCGSGSGLDPASMGSLPWIRIWIRI
jgi:hypothetical protein